jgi:integrase
MLNESLVFSISLLRAILAGKTFKETALRSNLTPAAIRIRVRRLALYLHRFGALPELSPASLKYVSNLRENKDRIEAALTRAESDAAFSAGYRSRKKVVLDNDAIETIILRAGFRSQTPLRDAALVHAALATGVRATEVAKLQIQDYLNSDGSVRVHSTLGADTAFNCRPRALYFFHPGSVRAIDAYLNERLQKKNPPPAPDAPLRGFSPLEALFLNDDGEPFMEKHGKRGQNRQILDTYRRILVRADIPGLNLMALRRTFAVRLLKQGASANEIKTFLGVSNVKNLLDLLPAPQSVADLMTGLYPDNPRHMPDR